MAKNTSRRNFLRTAPVAAAVSLSLPSMTHELLAQAAPATAGMAPGADVASAALPFQVFTAKALDDDAKALAAKPGNNNLVDQKPGIPCAIVMTTEVHHSATEFEWHEGRDHIIQIIDGSTLYEVGGVPKNGRNTKPGEWLAPASEGSKSIVMGKGDMIVLPRGTPHRRSTEDSVTLILISPYRIMKA
jgi:mannose-6-phosphate isomerase-like protein (cupin superfamily)